MCGNVIYVCMLLFGCFVPFDSPPFSVFNCFSHYSWHIKYDDDNATDNNISVNCSMLQAYEISLVQYDNLATASSTRDSDI